MDFRRSDRHFKLSSDPRQQNAADASVAPEPEIIVPDTQPQVQQMPTQEVPTSTPAPAQPEVMAVNFEPAPPAAPVVAPPVIESMQTAAPEPAPAPVQEPAPEPVAQAVESHVLQPAVASNRQAPKVKNRSGVPLKYVIISILILSIALIGSVVWQQMAIAELKKEREAQSEQLKQVNPISVGGGDSKNE